MKTFHKVINNQSLTNRKPSISLNANTDVTGDNGSILRNVKLDYDDFSETEDLMEGIDVNTDVHQDEDSKVWYREEELHATEEDLKELEAKEYQCLVCKQQFVNSTVLMEHSLSCGRVAVQGINF